MARPKIKDRGEIKRMLTISVEEKYLENRDIDEIKKLAYNSIVGEYLFPSPKFINNQKTK